MDSVNYTKNFSFNDESNITDDNLELTNDFSTDNLNLLLESNDSNQNINESNLKNNFDLPYDINSISNLPSSNPSAFKKNKVEYGNILDPILTESINTNAKAINKGNEPVLSNEIFLESQQNAINRETTSVLVESNSLKNYSISLTNYSNVDLNNFKSLPGNLNVKPMPVINATNSTGMLNPPEKNQKMNESASNDFFNETLKNLRDKKIKIKIKNSSISNSSRIVDSSMDQSSQEMKNSVVKDSLIIENKITPTNQYLKSNNPNDYFLSKPILGGLHNKKNNPIFWSTMPGVEKINESANTLESFSTKSNSQVQLQTSDQNKEDMKNVIAKLLFQKDIALDKAKIEEIYRSKNTGPNRDRKDNPLFYSTNPEAKTKIDPVGPNDKIVDEFLVMPKLVTKLLEEENNNMRTVEQYIVEQKNKVKEDINKIMNEINNILNFHQQITITKLDDYFDNYKKNYIVFKQKVQEFKEKSKIFSGNNQDSLGKTNIQQGFNPILKSIEYYKVSKSPYNPQPIKIKEEIANIQANAKSINTEIQAKYLLLLADELKKQTINHPLYKHTEGLNTILLEYQTNILNFIKNELRNFSTEMLFTPSFEDLSCLYALPKIETQICDDHLSIIGNSDNISNIKLFIEKYGNFGDHLDQSTCMHVLPGDLVAIGSSTGHIRLWNYSNDQNYGIFKAQSGPVTIISTMKAQLPEFNGFVLLTSGALPDNIIRIWTFPGYHCIRALKGHKDSITSLLPLSDGITLLSSSKESEIYVWNISTGKLFNKIAHHNGSINALVPLKENIRFISASSDKSFCVWKIIYSYSADYKRRIFYACELEKKFIDSCEIFTVNSAIINPYIVFTGGLDNKIKIWNIENDICIQEIETHQNGIAEIIYFENPFKLEWENNFSILSLGFNDDRLILSRSNNTKGVLVTRDESIITQRNLIVHHHMQIIKEKNGRIKVLTLGKNTHKDILVWALQD